MALLRVNRNPTYEEIMHAAQKGVSDTCAKAQAAIDNKFKEAKPSLLPPSLSFLLPPFMKTSALKEMKQLEDQLVRKWHPQLSSVEPLVSFPA